jgi:glycosyltransferase involved in cell wall biosynthesis
MVAVGCPDARPPAYQAVVGLARAGMLDGFLTAFYYGPNHPAPALARRLLTQRMKRWERVLRRRHEPEIPRELVHSVWSYDLSVALENRLVARHPKAGRLLARNRTRRFDRQLARFLERRRPGAALVFSDLASDCALPACRALGIASVLSMVHGDVREERRVLEEEAERSPDFFPIYLGQGAIDFDQLAWLHERRLRDLECADRILVPSEHIAAALVTSGTPRQRIAVVPYAADTRRFVPNREKRPGPQCTFLFAGGITQRKGIKYLLEAWRRVRRPGWRLQLLGALPTEPGPLRCYLDEVELLGRASHAEVPGRMAAADVFVFPSLFEGSAVVTYEALACGLPSIVTPSAGSVVRDGVEGFVVSVRDVEALAERMERLGTDPGLRSAFARAARARAEEFDWPRYHARVVAEVQAAGCSP